MTRRQQKDFEHIIVFFFVFLLTNNSKSPFNVHTKWKTNSLMTVLGWVERHVHSLTKNSGGGTVCLDAKDPRRGFKLSRENKSQFSRWWPEHFATASSIVHRLPRLKMMMSKIYFGKETSTNPRWVTGLILLLGLFFFLYKTTPLWDIATRRWDNDMSPMPNEVKCMQGAGRPAGRSGDSVLLCFTAASWHQDTVCPSDTHWDWLSPLEACVCVSVWVGVLFCHRPYTLQWRLRPCPHGKAPPPEHQNAGRKVITGKFFTASI